ncbi:MAG: hypothetical protein DWH74_01285 [Planctomycetota bacterium]|nr:MAG: hypothetical protein DWH74_01285 [Planctomycetota bacterium]
MSQLEPIAWIALVARWVEIARASRAIPAENSRLRETVAPLIALEATTAALGELTRLPESERAHARVLAEITVRNCATEFDRLWNDCDPSADSDPRAEDFSRLLDDALADAQRALRCAIYAGLEELVVVGEGAYQVPALALHFGETDPSTHHGTLAAMAPGSIAMPNEPVAWWCGRPAPTVDDPRLDRRLADAPRQVHRTIDESGRFLRDRMVSILQENEGDCAPQALPLLIPLLLDGTRIGRFLHGQDELLAMQRAALAGRATIPVEP